MMKTIVLTVLIAFTTIGLSYAQEDEIETIDMKASPNKMDFPEVDDNDDMQTLFGSDVSVGGFAGFQMKMADFNGNYGLLAGGELALVTNHALNFGVAGYGLTTAVKSRFNNEAGEPLYYDLGYGGVLIEPVIASKKVVHFSIPILLGAGGYGLSEGVYYLDDVYPGWESSGSFGIAETGLNIELNLFKTMRFVAGASYRFVGSTNSIGVMNNDLSGFAGNIGLRFGWF